MLGPCAGGGPEDGAQGSWKQAGGAGKSYDPPRFAFRGSAAGVEFKTKHRKFVSALTEDRCGTAAAPRERRSLPPRAQLANRACCVPCSHARGGAQASCVRATGEAGAVGACADCPIMARRAKWRSTRTRNSCLAWISSISRCRAWGAGVAVYACGSAQAQAG